MSRWLLVAVLPVALLAVACSKPRQAAAPRTVTVYMWSDYIDPNLVGQFERQTGLKVQLDVYENTEEMMAKLQQVGGQYDVLVVSDHAIPVLIKLGRLQALDLAQVPNAANVSDRFVKPPYDPQGRYSLPYQWGTMGLMYRKDKAPNLEASWATVFDPNRQPGAVSLIDSMRDLMAAALIYQGKGVNSRDPAEIRAAGELILRAKKSGKVVGFDGSVGAVKKVLAGDAAVAIAYNGDAIREMDDTCGYVTPKEGTIVWVDAMTIPAGAPNKDGALRFMNFILDAQVGADLSDYNSYASPNKASLPLIDKEMLANPEVYPPDEMARKMPMLEDVKEDTKLYDEMWTRIKAN